MPDPRSSALRFILTLGVISLLADVTYEGARSINGPFLGMLGAGAAAIGIVSGAGELMGYLLRLAGGVAADRTGRYWMLAAAGYVLNLVAVPFLALAGSSGVAAALIIAERAGKGIRTPSRDVMLSQAAHVVGRGRGLGLHEFMDQTGAFLGPLLVALVLKETHQYPRAYALLGVPALLAIATLLAAILVYPNTARFEKPASHPVASSAPLPRSYWLYVAAGGLMAAGIVDFPIIAFHFQKTSLATPAEIPVSYSIAMAVEGLCALAAGRLFDRIGTRALFLGVVLAAASTPLVFSGSFPLALAGVSLWGAGLGAQQTPLRATIANLVPVSQRGAAYGIFYTAFGLLWFAGSSAIGVLYGRSLAAAIAFAMSAQLASIPLLLLARKESA